MLELLQIPSWPVRMVDVLVIPRLLEGFFVGGNLANPILDTI